MFKIYDGREYFYQWDLDRKLIVEDPSIIEVHFCNRTDNCSLVCETYVEDGITLANVPNILLQTDWKIHVYAYDGTHTKHDECYEVKSRTKPSDYVYTETEIKNYDELEARVTALEQNGTGGGGAASNDFIVTITENPFTRELTVDKTPQEIMDAYNDGKNIKGYYTDGHNKDELLSSIYGISNIIFTLVSLYGGTEFRCHEDACYKHSRTSEDIENKVYAIDKESGTLLNNYPTCQAVVDYVADEVGDIETALDNIIEIQNSLLGVSE